MWSAMEMHLSCLQLWGTQMTKNLKSPLHSCQGQHLSAVGLLGWKLWLPHSPSALPKLSWTALWSKIFLSNFISIILFSMGVRNTQWSTALTASSRSFSFSLTGVFARESWCVSSDLSIYFLEDLSKHTVGRGGHLQIHLRSLASFDERSESYVLH